MTRLPTSQDRLKNVSLGTSKINYNDPRITVTPSLTLTLALSLTLALTLTLTLTPTLTLTTDPDH